MNKSRSYIHSSRGVALDEMHSERCSQLPVFFRCAVAVGVVVRVSRERPVGTGADGTPAGGVWPMFVVVCTERSTG